MFDDPKCLHAIVIYQAKFFVFTGLLISLDQGGKLSNYYKVSIPPVIINPITIMGAFQAVQRLFLSWTGDTCSGWPCFGECIETGFEVVENEYDHYQLCICKDNTVRHNVTDCRAGK